MDESNINARTGPRSHRVGMTISPTEFRFQSTSPPTPPPRSPLRPITRSISSLKSIRSSISQDSSSAEEVQQDPMPLLKRPSFASINGLLETINFSESPPHSPKSISMSQSDSPLQCLSPVDMDDDSSASSLAIPSVTKPLSKRIHALLELINSERAYASDLALIRDIHIPLALGNSAPFHPVPVTPPDSNPSSRALSTASDSSTAPTSPPMSREDTRVIFSNVAELALFADTFSERLQEALGDVLEGGEGEDHVGALFLEIIPKLEPPYKTYITRHPSALAHLSSLTQSPSPALAGYLSHTRTLASSLTHAWDLPSLLIKPVQRLLKYSLLLQAIIDETPDAHSDKASLRAAKEKMEEVARGVNEDRRRWEVVKEVLQTDGKKSVPINVSLTRMKSLRTATKLRDCQNEEAEAVERMERELRATESFVKAYAKNAVEWARSVRALMGHLREWAMTFGRVIGLSDDQGSEAFDAFLLVVESELLPLCNELEVAVQDRWVRELGKLLESMRPPLRLINAMNSLEPLHYTLLNTTFTPRARPPPALLEASQSYLALRGQLHAELPTYLSLLQRGIAKTVIGLGDIQSQWWGAVRERWGTLWEALRVEGEGNAGASETLRVWWGRWAEVERMANGLSIVSRRGLVREKDRPRSERSRGRDREKISSSPVKERSQATSAAQGMLSSLDPPHQRPTINTSGITPTRTSGHSIARTHSNESLHSGKPNKLNKPNSHRRRNSNVTTQEEFGEYVPIPSMPRTKSMPTPIQTSSSSSSSAQRVEEPEYDDRGRPLRKPSIRRKLTDSISHRRRSSSVRSIGLPSPTTTGGSLSFFIRDSTSTTTSHSSYSERLSMNDMRPKYACKTVHPCRPPSGVSYRGIPFFTLEVDDVYDVLKEAGHPSTHEELPLYIDDGEDCLLLVRAEDGAIGWALASFLIPLD